MSYILFHYDLKDFDKWKQHFDSERQNRKVAGEKSYHLMAVDNVKENIVILHQWDNLVNARKYFDTIAFRKAMTNCGVTGKPSIDYLESIEIQRVHGIRKEL